ncbi:MAG TPA: ATP-binding protein [Rhizomicrobium sp.]|nr:ATP-binding protein [Rhizomicrobium sp.]
MAESDKTAARVAALEAELRNERAQFALAERAARVAYWRYCLADRRIVWSPGMYRLLGIDPALQSPSHDWLMNQVQPEDAALVEEKIANAIRTRSPFYYRTHARDPNSAIQIVETHGEVEIGPDGRVVSVIGVCHDITKQVVAETKRAEAEERYRVMMEEASDIIMLHAAGGRVEFASAALERILGRTLREFDDTGYLAIVHPDDREEAEKVSRRPPPGETYTATYRARHRDGHYVWIEVTTRSVFDEATGEFRHVVAVSRDVSERKRQELEMRAAREAAEAANRAKSAFLANMSHELRTPLNAILGFTDIMRDEMFGPVSNPRYSEYIALIHSSGQLLLDLIGDVLDMAKIEAGKLQLVFEDVNLSNVLDECAQVVSDRAKSAGVDIRLRTNGTICSADRRAMKQIVLNLLSNAVKFTPAGGSVEALDEIVGDRVRIVIADTGIGIAPEDLPRLANPFEQVCADPKLAKSGTGLGLSLVRALAEKHGGTLAIASQPAEGTIVTVEFPHVACVQVA